MCVNRTHMHYAAAVPVRLSHPGGAEQRTATGVMTIGDVHLHAGLPAAGTWQPCHTAERADGVPLLGGLPAMEPAAPRLQGRDAAATRDPVQR